MSDLLAHLNEVNDVEIISVSDDRFKTYGNIVNGYDFSQMISYMKEKTAIPSDGNCYVASVPEMEQDSEAVTIQNVMYGGMEIEVGYCNGRNTTYNGFEYHKGSEINVAVTDFMLVLAHIWDVKNNHISIDQAQVFLVPKGTAIEMYQTTLHLSPLRVNDEGFKDIVILPQGTNTPLTGKHPQDINEESVLLLQKNKWVISHPDRKPLTNQGAFPGLDGENKELFY